jgi:hypothetical protein
VVFTFSEGIPGYTVGYVTEVVSDPKGNVVLIQQWPDLALGLEDDAGDDAEQ